jgi:hypothetical protein
MGRSGGVMEYLTAVLLIVFFCGVLAGIGLGYFIDY